MLKEEPVVLPWKGLLIPFRTCYVVFVESLLSAEEGKDRKMLVQL